jgi:hypothetical protein
MAIPAFRAMFDGLIVCGSESSPSRSSKPAQSQRSIVPSCSPRIRLPSTESLQTVIR